jgi:hypothetical protein
MPTRITSLLVSLVLLVFGTIPTRGELQLGVNGHPVTSYPGVSLEQQIAYVADLGLKSYRVDISSLSQVDRLGELVKLAKARGIEILPVITPKFSLSKESTEDLYKWSFNLAVKLVSRFKNEIRVWELGNEMEIGAIIRPCEMRDDGRQYPCEWGPAGGVNVLDYFGPRWKKVSSVLKGLSDGTASVDPKIRRAMGTAGWGHIGAFERMRLDGIEWDISVWHMYGQDPEWAFEKLAAYGKPIWVTEFNHPKGSKSGEPEQANGIRLWIARLRELADKYDVETAHIYELLDEEYWGEDFEAKMGLVRLESDGAGSWKAGEAKPAYFAVKEQASVEGAQTSAALSPRAADSIAIAIAARNCRLEAPDLGADGPERSRIHYAYCLVLGREPDFNGMLSYESSLSKGITFEKVLLKMLNSSEFKARIRPFTKEPAVFVAAMYRLLLDRAVDEVGFETYTTLLKQQALTQTELIQQLLRSNEFRKRHQLLFGSITRAVNGFSELTPQSVARNFRRCKLDGLANRLLSIETQVAYAYCLILGRYADNEGLRNYVIWIENGMTIGEALISLAESEEFQAKTHGNRLTDTAYLTLLEVLLLNKGAEQSIRTAKIGAVHGVGNVRQKFVRDLISSSDFRDSQPFLFPNG